MTVGRPARPSDTFLCWPPDPASKTPQHLLIDYFWHAASSPEAFPGHSNVLIRLKELIAMVCLLACAMPVTAFAQSAVDEAPPSTFIFGPLGLTPRIALRNVGVDTNPLNEPGEPARDFTATLVPGVDSTLRIGRGRLTGKTSLEYVHFNQTRSQRSANVNQEARAELLLNRITPYAVGTYLRTRQRPTPEID